MLGSVEDIILANSALTADSFLINWMNFMNGGGRLALTIVAALAAFGGSHFLSRSRIFYRAEA